MTVEICVLGYENNTSSSNIFGWTKFISEEKDMQYDSVV